MIGRGRVARIAVLSLATTVAACGSGPTGPGGGGGARVWVLNSVGQTLAPFVAGDRLSSGGAPVALPANFDGDAFDLRGSEAVTTVSAFGGSQLLFASLSDGSVSVTGFPGPDSLAARVDPSRASFGPGGDAWLGGRGSNAIYRASPGDQRASLYLANPGDTLFRTITQVLPTADRLYVIDANLDDQGDYQPLGPSRVFVVSRGSPPAVERTTTFEAGLVNATSAVLLDGRLFVLAAGSFNPDFTPRGNGHLEVLDAQGLGGVMDYALGGNGVSLEAGADGMLYLTVTDDFVSIRLLRVDPAGTSQSGGTVTIDARAPSGDPIDCWTATALADGRIVCATFRTDRSGTLYLMGSDGVAVDSAAAGFGSTDLAVP